MLRFMCVACVARVPRATRVSVGMAMSGLDALMIAMREALSASVDLDTTLGTLTGDPWAREVRGTLQRRWAVLDELAAELRDYVEMQNTTLANAVSTGTPALVGGLVTLDARDTAACVAEHIARATPAPQPRPSRVGPNKIPGGGAAAARDPARWADELVDTPRAASSQAPPVLAAAVATHLLPQPGARVQAPYKAPLGLVTPPTSAPQLGTPIPTQAIATRGRLGKLAFAHAAHHRRTTDAHCVACTGGAVTQRPGVAACRHRWWHGDTSGTVGHKVTHGVATRWCCALLGAWQALRVEDCDGRLAEQRRARSRADLSFA